MAPYFTVPQNLCLPYVSKTSSSRSEEINLGVAVPPSAKKGLILFIGELT